VCIIIINNIINVCSNVLKYININNNINNNNINIMCMIIIIMKIMIIQW